MFSFVAANGGCDMMVFFVMWGPDVSCIFYNWQCKGHGFGTSNFPFLNALQHGKHSVGPSNDLKRNVKIRIVFFKRENALLLR